MGFLKNLWELFFLFHLRGTSILLENFHLFVFMMLLLII
jgi:hypothetical protein